MADRGGYSWNEVLAVAQHYWANRDYNRGTHETLARIADVSRAYDQLTENERRQLFLGVWLERTEIPSAVITKMMRYLNGR